MLRRAAWLLLALLTVLAAPASTLATTASPLPSFEAHYTLSFNGLNVATVVRSLRPDGAKQYIFESVTEPTGVLSIVRDDRIREVSQWVYADNGTVRPVHYSYHHSGSKRDRQAELSFDWTKGEVQNMVENEPWTMEIPPGTQDKLGYMLELMLDLRANRAPLEYPVADGGRLKVYSAVRKGEEELDTPLGKLHTIKVQREPDHKGRVTTLWCAESLAYLPVRIEHREHDGSVYTAEITAVSGPVVRP